MAVIVDFVVPGATPEQMYQVEALTQERGKAVGRPPFTGCMFIAATAIASGFRFVSAWRGEADFRAVLEDMLGPDLASVGLSAADIQTSSVFSMAIPGALSG
ncbi:hypothetical protein GCM10023168_36370 [Fodinibacter luteus]|uniref:ABM domain-containing protein n=1 Tax=Fodinibacter luteus TaxID=552064 RepID=A0ABP8KSF9_9MICO